MGEIIDVIERPEDRHSVEWLPCIFGNGEDDDTPGLVAALAGEKVLVGDTVFKAEDAVLIDGMSLVFDRRIDATGEGTERVCFGTMWPEDTSIKVALSGRAITISHCYIHFRGRFYDSHASSKGE